MKSLIAVAHKQMLRMDPERAHDLAIQGTRMLGKIKSSAPSIVQQPVNLLGMTFPNPLGLAAGLDKNARAFNGFFQLGFGFVEVGTVTPKPQPGNPKPRIFRLPEACAVINRMGFNNLGVDALVNEVRSNKPHGILGINLGKNKATPEDRAADDYVIGLQKVYGLADYVTVNISSPNTPGLRDLQHGDAMKQLLSAVKMKQQALADQSGRYVPILVKIAPDVDADEVNVMVDAVRKANLDGIIATNTTIDKSKVSHLPFGDEVGGLSGQPVREKSTEVLKQVRSAAGADFPIIGVGGIMCGQDAVNKLQAGADLVQVYTGFVYKGPTLVDDILSAIKKAQA